eukprot:CAMPEP_0196654606 /NCGR_PEP_ID=MMETSP1086-20130531/4333_1 /TAXON_ID=77921 /ORGANISM="Cyanoptyche  gloeocystis , Strain SAG4.97" /LENGTH=267 /DNA_ID=CAMNT_0041986463 /DNA_START=194 /DNA_END=997 /DNA_ORIENTATION=-
MRFRPCIDLHKGKVVQIVGSTLKDDEDSGKSTAAVNFETSTDAAHFAKMYREDDLPGGHVIMLGPGNEEAALSALSSYPGGLQIGGGITSANAAKFLDSGASHVVVTSYVFRDGVIDFARLSELVSAVGKNRLVLDLSCRSREDGAYVVCTDRWQKTTDTLVSGETLENLARHCDQFLVHAVDVEGKRAGVLEDLVVKLSHWSPIAVTYCGGARSISDLERVLELGAGRVDVTIGSALDIFGGNLKYADVVAWQRNLEAHRVPNPLQ